MKVTLEGERLQALLNHLVCAVVFAAAARQAAEEAAAIIEHCCHQAEAEAEEQPVAVRLL